MTNTEQENGVEFRPGHYYQHRSSFAVMHIICEINSFFYGKSWLAEDERGTFRPVSQNPADSVGWYVVSGWPRDVYDGNSIPEPIRKPFDG